MQNKLVFFISLTIAILFNSNAWACGGEESGKHVGNVTSINDNSFTIRDAETHSSMTFNAEPAILSDIKTARGQIVVNYEEDDEGALHAVAVSF
ncbi:MAG TPA: hypothetical protein ENK06_11390 [Gammaproteobacteria bacterium]|nr:hypothetical protein [Gammaproteobacteria bacterium]